MRIKTLFVCIVTFLFLQSASYSDDKKLKTGSNTTKEFDATSGINMYSGVFDFSDDGQRANLFGIEHQNHNLYRDTPLGRFSPVTGFFITENNASYIYTGIEANYELGPINFTPSFTPGLYSQGDGKDLGSPIEFKTDLQLSYDFGETTNIGMSYNHVSNASIGDKNPGANSYMFNFLKKF